MPPGQHPEQIGKPIQIGNNLAGGFEPLKPYGLNTVAFSTPHDRSPKIEGCANSVLAGEHELSRRVETAGDVINDGFKRRDHRRVHAGHLIGELVTIFGRGRQFGAHDEELAL